MNRITQIKKLGWIFERNDDGEFKRFNYSERNPDVFRPLRIPDHQRFPNWNKEKKQKLINSILKNYPIHSIICSKHHLIRGNSVKEYLDIEDGQTRLSILESYYNNDFPDEFGHTFNELTSSQQRAFENYEITMDVITVEDENDIHEIFDRLQMGQPLRDCDKFWNWKKEPLVKYAIDLIGTKRLDKYMGTSKFSTQKRDRLSDIVGLLSLIMQWNIVTSEYINNSFKSHFKNIKKTVTDEDKEKVEEFLEYYFEIIDKGYELYPKRNNEKCKKYYNICNDLGLIIYDYFQNSDNDALCRKDLWANYFALTRKNKSLTMGKKQLWNNVEGKPNWTQPKYVGARVDRVYEFYDKLKNGDFEKFCKENNIEIDVELDYTSEEESDEE